MGEGGGDDSKRMCGGKGRDIPHYNSQPPHQQVLYTMLPCLCSREVVNTVAGKVLEKKKKLHTGNGCSPLIHQSNNLLQMRTCTFSLLEYVFLALFQNNISFWKQLNTPHLPSIIHYLRISLCSMQ